MNNPRSDQVNPYTAPELAPQDLLPKEIAGKVSTFAWIVVLLLFPVALLNYLDRQMLAAMKSSMVGDIQGIANEAQWGFVLGSFKWVYALLSPFGGYVADRFSRRLVIGFSLLVWSAVTWMTAWVNSYEMLIATRALMGISEAFYIPAALALITDFHVGATRSRAVGLHQAGIYCGLIVGGMAGFVAESPAYGWRWAFSACGIIGVLYSLPLFIFLRSPERSVEKQNLSPAQSINELRRNRNFLLLVLYFTLPAIAGWVVKDWMPAILKQQFNLGQGAAGVSATLYWNLAALLGVFVGGWLADRWARTQPRGRMFVSAMGITLLAPALFGVGNGGTLHRPLHGARPAAGADVQTAQAQGVAHFLGVVIFAAVDGVPAPAHHQPGAVVRRQHTRIAQNLEYRVGDAATAREVKLHTPLEFMGDVEDVA